MARDKFHYNVRTALEKDGWTITDDPLRIESGDVKREINLSAEKNGQRIAVAIKGFNASLSVKDFAKAYGKFKLCRRILSEQSVRRELYLAIPDFAYHNFFQKSLIQEITKKEQIYLLVLNQLKEEIVEWINW